MEAMPQIIATPKKPRKMRCDSRQPVRHVWCLRMGITQSQLRRLTAKSQAAVDAMVLDHNTGCGSSEETYAVVHYAAKLGLETWWDGGLWPEFMIFGSRHHEPLPD